ncbi:porin family protein [Zobellia uliginosa]|uniref:porin family protein n=1 Tax=Zobellia uliginosa TaxID=143224 RepID=UPI001C073B5B|nr:porin family protein [Zobellia uliginosa]MBU2946940.1 PorT family protein [Zobellia uliginosa]
MKIKFCAFVALVFFGVQSSSAQTVIQGTGPSSGINSGDITLGGKTGISFTTLTGKNLDGVSTKVGAYVGGIVEIPVMDNFYLQPELLFAFKGADLGPSNLNLLYLQIPVMAKYHITDEIAVELGPQAGFLIADNWDEDLELRDTNSIDIGLNVGGGYRMDENFYFQLRVELGLSKVLEIPETHNTAVSVGAVYFL